MTINNSSFKTILKNLCLKNDGFTYNMNLKPNKAKKGFFIALTDNSDKDLDKAILNLMKIRKNKFKHLPNKLLNVGFWSDKETNKFYLDLSIHNKNLKNSLLIANLFNQKAIWDISKIQEIRIIKV